MSNIKIERNWVSGSANRYTFSGKDGGTIRKHVLSMKKSDLESFEENDRGYIRLAYIEKEKDKYGNEGMLFEDDYLKYKKMQDAKNNAEEASNDAEVDDDGDLPF